MSEITQEGFMMTADAAFEFFSLCEKLKAQTKEERTELLRTFVAHKKAKYLRDPKEFIKGKKVLSVRKKPENG